MCDDNDLMTKIFFCSFWSGQPILFEFQDKKLLGLAVKSLEAVDPAAAMSMSDKQAEPKKTRFGRLLRNSTAMFEKAEALDKEFIACTRISYIKLFLYFVFIFR